MVTCHLKGYRPDLGYKKIIRKAYKDVVMGFPKPFLLSPYLLYSMGNTVVFPEC